MVDFQNTIDRYFELNLKATEDLSPFVVREFSPSTFHRFNYSTEIRQKSDLWKFADCQHENRFNENIDLLGGAISQREFEWIKEISVKVLELTADMNHPVVVKNSITRAVLHLRAILGAAAVKGKQSEKLSEWYLPRIGPMAEPVVDAGVKGELGEEQQAAAWIRGMNILARKSAERLGKRSKRIVVFKVSQ
jgi:hypothetical protein